MCTHPLSHARRERASSVRHAAMARVVAMVSPKTTSIPALAQVLDPALEDLGVRLHEGGGTLRVFSQAADAIDVVIFDADDLDWATAILPMQRRERGVWEITSEL